MKKEVERINKAYLKRYNKNVKITDLFWSAGYPREYYSQFSNLSEDLQNQITNKLSKMSAEDVVKFRIIREYGFIPR